MQGHCGFIFPMTTHRKSRFSIFLKGATILDWIMIFIFNLAALAPSKRVPSSFEALKSGTDFFFYSYGILGGMES